MVCSIYVLVLKPLLLVGIRGEQKGFAVQPPNVVDGKPKKLGLSYAADASVLEATDSAKAKFTDPDIATEQSSCVLIKHKGRVKEQGGWW